VPVGDALTSPALGRLQEAPAKLVKLVLVGRQGFLADLDSPSASLQH
jgi:hypothetical protein